MSSGQTVTGKYERKIKYLDYMENGVRTKGAGFVRLERWDELCGIDVQISGLYRRDHFSRPLLLLWNGQERELCRLEFGEGGSKLSLEKIDVHDMDGQGLPYEELAGLRIPVSEGKEIRCVWGELQPLEKEAAERRKPEEAEKAAERAVPAAEKAAEKAVPAAEKKGAERAAEKAVAEREIQAERNVPSEKNVPMAWNLPAEEDLSQAYIEPEQGEMPRAYVGPEQVEMPRAYAAPEKGEMQPAYVGLEQPEMSRAYAEPEQPEMSRAYAEPRAPQIYAEPRPEAPVNDGEQKAPAVMMREEKWEQLQTIYPHIFPFRDEREYLSMGPADFVILPRRYYKLVSNSFLLHGFYNYDHLILARVEQQGAIKYYIGVPGNYYEREKKVAVLFGFQSFECESEPAKEGDFGYYMIPVEL